MFVAEQFTGRPGKYVERKETVRGAREILEGKHDQLPEQAFLMAGPIEDVVENAESMKGKVNGPLLKSSGTSNTGALEMMACHCS